MIPSAPNIDQGRFRAISRSNVARTPQWRRLDPELREAVMVVSTVLPFRTNPYVMDSLIDWNRVPEDPIFQLTFPQKGMLADEHYRRMAELIRAGAPPDQIQRAANQIRYFLNPHPAGQMTHNVPLHHGDPIRGIQHKYRQTVLFFPAQGQTCHAYCTFCFRWAQFVGIDELRFSNRDVEQLVAYLKDHPEVTDVLLTGGDPMVMKTSVLRRYIEALLIPELEHVQTIRVGTKAPAYWPQRFVTDPDADDLLRLFEEVADSGRHLALMGHYTHPTELSTRVAEQALRRIRSTGAVVRMQGPLIRHVNDNPDAWARLWRHGVRLGAVPYYMFVERDTGASSYFEVPLVRAWEIFRQAYQQIPGTCRTVRGPSMSAFPGKVHIVGLSHVNGQDVFVLEYIQARDPGMVRQPFFARYDPKAVWFDQLQPATKRDRAFFPTTDDREWQPIPWRVGDRAAG